MVSKKQIKKIAKMMEMPKIDNKFCADMLKSVRDFRLKDGSLPFGTCDYMYLDECINYLEISVKDEKVKKDV